jgi:hypothetical protein
MKLLFCLDCYDIVKLLNTERICSCGKSKGMYIDKLNATYSGNAKLLGFSNTSFSNAVREQIYRDNKNFKLTYLDGAEFTAFIIPESSSSINKTDK